MSYPTPGGMGPHADPSWPVPGHDLARRRMAELPRVLVVEDDPSTVELMQRLLMRQGYEVPAAASYGDALHMATEWLPDVLISDLALPGKTGFRCSRRCAKRTRA